MELVPELHVFQNSGFETTALDLRGKRAFNRFFRELVAKPAGF
jgi:hypothetical protein